MTKEQILARISAEGDAIVSQYRHHRLPENENFAVPPAQLIEDFINMTAYTPMKMSQVIKEDHLTAADPKALSSYLNELSLIAAIGRNLVLRELSPEHVFFMLTAWLNQRKIDFVKSLYDQGIPTVPRVELGRIRDSAQRGIMVAVDFSLHGLLSMKSQPTSMGDLMNQYLEGASVFSGRTTQRK